MSFAVCMEIFGYIGTVLVIISMLMTSVVKLRIINLCGALISLVYAITVAAWPIAVMNLALSIIQLCQLYRLYAENRRGNSVRKNPQNSHERN